VICKKNKIYRSKKVSLISFLPHHVHVILLLIPGLTIFIIAGLGAKFELGLKRIVALSTLRYLRLMIITINIGFSGLAFSVY
jgi:hypothetical protein